MSTAAPPASAATPAATPAERRRSLAGTLARRLRDTVVVLFLVLVVIFVIGHVVGDPVRSFASPDATDEQLAQLRSAMGLDRPFHEQFLGFLGDVARLDMGTSLWQQRPAMDAVMEVLANTVVLAVAGLIAAALFGVVGGVLAGSRPGTWVDRVVSTLSVISTSVANFWVGLLLIVVFAVYLRLVPTSGWYTWSSLLLPAVTLGFAHGGRICQVVRAVVLAEMTKPYVLAATSRGLPWRRLVANHALRNSGTTVVTTVGWEFARMFGGSIFPIEVVFAWPGLGPLMTTAAGRHDFPIVAAAVLVTGVLVIVVNAVVDLVGHLMDRRLGTGTAAEVPR